MFKQMIQLKSLKKKLNLNLGFKWKDKKFCIKTNRFKMIVS